MELEEAQNYPTKLPVLVEDELFLYPFMITPIFIGDNANLKAMELALKNDTMILVVPSKFENARSFDEIYDCGVIGNIMRKVPLPDGRVKILFQGYAKARILERMSSKPLEALVDIIHEEPLKNAKKDALLGVLKEKVKILANISAYFSPDLLRTIEEGLDASRICDLILNTIRIKKSDAYSFFILTSLETKLTRLIDLIAQEIEANKIQKEIKNKVHSKIDKVNKEYFLKEQLRQIQRELGTDAEREDELKEYYKKLESKKKFMYEDAYKEIKKQIEKFERIHQDNSEASMIQTYIETALDVPFEKVSKKKLDIKEVIKQLDNDHYALKKPKERIEEYFAVRELLEKRDVNDKDSAKVILCLYGPPGVGKTSLANSVAKALKRELIRIALGGLEDVNELRGHRRTYIGAMPGRVTQGLIEAKQINPVVVLDEIDKLNRSFRGDPSAALLEILDPEQNSKFRDYYLNFNIDLSKVIFIATANDISDIPSALRDRMEFIELSSYTPIEKFNICKKYLIPDELKKHGLKASELSLKEDVIELIINDYTRESGVRTLRRKIAQICRKVAKKLLLEDCKKVSITTKNLSEFLDKKVYEAQKKDDDDKVGQVNGLAWTPVGGDVLKIEAIKIKGKGDLMLTGSLGDVMKESAQIALSVNKVLIDSKKLIVPKKLILNPKTNAYDQYNLHIHVPDGATPKDGPSAGVTMSTVIASVFSDRPVRADVAMTGEIDLAGKILPIGGLKEKLIAAYKADIKIALIPRKNYERDLKDIPSEIKDNMQIIAVDYFDEVLKIALV
ncbi:MULTISPECIES: endopeptidase La [unclassified Campylobacter]|uniref:endopeptidase La n=1 Tax=unclassified Campylobacter TaxID=2593542 RepID=UPI0012382874|nr:MULTISPECIES: endopeptidase La [unclassified Campylobacter]KAA6225952.1 endopeptidase La [Campylobacter sp. LR286c]KAA6228160.1 endopeptidase La [Campylobacter sp. LR185c]KAA6228813.1 endopeptidase La [Campylobacter sp. LR196d]KAA6231216.1 endopeptidase La [Campylobacter sp. LR291e]KAA6234377.1 endopeptidase La [Campylobacter sp. LR264d]